MKPNKIGILFITILFSSISLASADELTRKIAKHKFVEKNWEYVYINVNAHKNTADGKKLASNNLVNTSKYNNDGSYSENNNNAEPNKKLINYFLGKENNNHLREFSLYYGRIINVEVTGVRKTSPSDGIRIADYLLTVEPNKIGELFAGPRKLPVYIEYQLYDDGWRFNKILWDEIHKTSNWAGKFLPRFLSQSSLNNEILWQMHEHDLYTSKMVELLETFKESDNPSYLDTVAWVYKDHGEPSKAIEIYEKKILPKIKAEQDIQRLNNYEQYYSKLKNSINDDQYFYKYTLSRDAIKGFKKSYLKQKNHRAFAFSNNSAWGWSKGQSNLDQAKKQAIKNCEYYNKSSNQPCEVIHYDNDWVAIEIPEKAKPDPILLTEQSWEDFPIENINISPGEAKNNYHYLCEKSISIDNKPNATGFLYHKNMLLHRFDAYDCNQEWSDPKIGIYFFPNRKINLIRLDSEKGTIYTLIHDFVNNTLGPIEITGQSGAYGNDIIISNDSELQTDNFMKVIAVIGSGKVNDKIAFYINGNVQYWSHSEHRNYSLERFGCSYIRSIYDYAWSTPSRLDIRYKMYPVAKVYGYEDYPCHEKYGTHLEVASIFVKPDGLDTYYWKHDYTDAVSWYIQSKAFENNKSNTKFPNNDKQQIESKIQLTNCKPNENHSVLAINLSEQTHKSSFVDTIGMFGGEFLMLSDETLEAGLKNGELNLLAKSIQVSIGDLKARKTIHQEKINGIFYYKLPEGLSEVGVKISGVTGKIESNWSDAQKISLKKGQCKIFNLVASEQFVFKLDKIKEDHNKQKEKQQEIAEKKRIRKQDELEAKQAEEQLRQQAISTFTQYIDPIRAKVTNSWLRPSSYKSGVVRPEFPRHIPVS